MNCKQKISRRDFLAVFGGCFVAVTFFPKIAFSAAKQGEIVAIRTGIQPGNKTRLVIETTQRPEYSLSYPEGQLIVRINATGKVTPKLTDGTLVKSIQVGAPQVTVNLRQTIAPIPKSNIMILEPNGKNKYRLVLDFSAGTNTAKTAVAAATATSQKPIERKPVIIIDPGHGGKDPGAIGLAGTKEKDIVLSVSKKLYDRLKSAGYNVSMTRRDDKFLNLGTRSEIGERKKADLFVSVHANANPSRAKKGFSVYVLSEKASDEEAQKMADAENAADKIDVDGVERMGHDLKLILSSLQQRQVSEDSHIFARHIMRATRTAGIQDVDKDPRSAPFAVLKSTVPSALVELGHLSHRDEEKLLKNSGYQDKLARAIATAIGKYDF